MIEEGATSFKRDYDDASDDDIELEDEAPKVKSSGKTKKKRRV
jgi:hypothetical protein